MKIIKYILFVLLIWCSSIYSVDRLYLNDNWQFRRVGDTVWYPATVPGTVHTDLYNNGLIPDPFYRDNEKDLQWIENEDWEYKCEFDLPDSVYNQTNIDLIFEGLDTYAKVYLNDSLVITADNMFMKWESEAKRFMQPGRNKLYILFESPIRKAKELKSGPELPGGDRVYTRKAAYQYGWDFGPRFVTSGIWRKVYIEGWSVIKIKSLSYSSELITNEKVILRISCNYQTDNSQGEYKIKIININTKEVLEETNWGYDESRNIKNFTSEKIIEHWIYKPKLWWCNGLGEPYLYQFIISIEKGGKFSDKRSMKIGIKRVELFQTEDSIGESFYFKLNAVPVYIKGTNFIPQDNFLPRVDSDKYKRLIEDAVSSNINMIRVWGGGIYQDEEFYNLCDEKGIMVWQDFMFANSMYPNIFGYKEYNDVVESIHDHPCLALFCGNNEIEEGWNNWGWQKQFSYSPQDSIKLWNEYDIIFNYYLRSAAARYSIPYIPTSPKIGWGHPEAMKEGDSHYWGVWWGMEPFEMFEKKIPRFMSEYGFQGFPDIKTIDSFTLSEDRYLYSSVMKAHQKHPTGYETIQTYMEHEYKQPKDFESYVYVSQLLQAYGIKQAIEAHRRAKPYCMGTMYWQLDDCWPGVTWSGIDYYGRWKAMQYFVKEAYKDILVSVHEENDSVKVWVVNDRMKDVKGKLIVELIDLSGTPLSPFPKGGSETNITVPINSSGVYFQILKNELVGENSLNNIVLVVNFIDEQGTEYNNLYYFVPPKDLALEDPQISYDVDKKTGELVLSCNKLAKNVHIEINYPTAPLNIENNYFDLLPGETVKINTDIKGLDINNVKITSLFDTY